MARCCHSHVQSRLLVHVGILWWHFFQCFVGVFLVITTLRTYSQHVALVNLSKLANLSFSLWIEKPMGIHELLRELFFWGEKQIRKLIYILFTGHGQCNMGKVGICLIFWGWMLFARLENWLVWRGRKLTEILQPNHHLCVDCSHLNQLKYRPRKYPECTTNSIWINKLACKS